MSTAPISMLNELQQVYGINPNDVLRLDGKPWLSSEQLATIARKAGGFVSIDVDFKEYVPDLKQVLWVASLIDNEGRTYRRTGVATIGEKLPSGQDVSPNDLAASRALRSALTMAGYDVFKGGTVVNLSPEVAKRLANYKPQPSDIRFVQEPNEVVQVPDWPGLRRNFLAELHALAQEVGLITIGEDNKPNLSAYRDWLLEEFDVNSSASFDEAEFAQAINKLKVMKNQQR